jgi:adenylate kinase family enzyme
MPASSSGPRRWLAEDLLAQPYREPVPLLGPADRLPLRPQRVLVAGTSGAGKTALAVQIAAVLHVPHVEIDALFHGPGWTARPSFVADVEALIAQPGWVTEWQYGQVRRRLAAAADVIAWLDLSRRRVTWQVTRRTLHRRLRRQQLWSGNIEPPLRTFFTDNEQIVRWAWRTHGETAIRVDRVLGERPELPVVRLPSHAAARRWLTGPLAEVVVRRPGSERS